MNCEALYKLLRYLRVMRKFDTPDSIWCIDSLVWVILNMEGWTYSQHNSCYNIEKEIELDNCYLIAGDILGISTKDNWFNEYTAILHIGFDEAHNMIEGAIETGDLIYYYHPQSDREPCTFEVCLTDGSVKTVNCDKVMVDNIGIHFWYSYGSNSFHHKDVISFCLVEDKELKSLNDLFREEDAEIIDGIETVRSVKVKPNNLTQTI